ncbi:MAG: hypothetical protein ACI4F4_01085 [Lachnospiraceae bacterium]
MAYLVAHNFVKKKRKGQMKNKANNMKMLIMMLGMFCAVLLCPKMVVFAGSINGNEARVIAAASGTFTYEGRTYRAQSSYINTLNVYLSRDGVDLTAAQADEAISRMYASVASGVSGGYLYEVNNTTEENTEDTSDTEENTTEENTSESSEEVTTEENTSDNTEESSEETDTIDFLDTVENSTEDIWQALDNPTEARTTLNQRPEEEEASVLVELSEDDVVVSTSNDKRVIISKKKEIIPSKIILGIQIVSLVVFAITLVCIVILLIKKCMVFRVKNRKRQKHGHSKRRVIRHRTRAVMTATTAVSIMGIFLLGGLKAGFFNTDIIMQNMQSSGYFRYAYSEYLAGVVADVESGELNATEIDDLQSYEDYLFTIKQNTRKILQGEKEAPIPDSNVAPYVRNLEESYQKLVEISGVALLISGILGMIFMFFMDQQRERGMKHMAASFLIAGFVMMIGVLILLFVKPYTYMYIEPDYLYLFLVACIKEFTSVMTAVTAFMVVVGMILFGLFVTIKNKRND